MQQWKASIQQVKKLQQQLKEHNKTYVWPQNLSIQNLQNSETDAGP
jgi:hypothetical protein